VASYGGVVHDLGNPGGVEINHGGGWFSLYLHMTNRSVQEGQTVQQGQQIGLTGDVGVDDEHLHYELRFDANGDGDSTNSEIVFASFNGVTYDMGANGERAFNVTSNN
jgi:murein DD-endopeptidase MepM/ murein hydrolase activator NlpD